MPTRFAASALGLGLSAALLAAPVLAQQQGQGQGQDQPRRPDIMGTLQALNGSGVTGMAAFKTSEGRLIASLGAANVPQGMHLAHLHGFTGESPKEATCPGPEADANGDGVVDLMETAQAAGTTLVPLNGRPADLQIKSESYPRADAEGTILYVETVDIEALTQALQQAHGTGLALETRVVMLHGVAEDTPVPDTAASLEGVPARVTLPIACAELSVKPIDR